jgi:inorganic pyrophosphatase
MKERLIFALMLVLISCSSSKKTDYEGGSDDPKGIINKIDPFWLEAHPKFVGKKTGGETPTHLFFDVENNFSDTGMYINYFVETLQGSEFKYNYDLTTGTHFVDRPYCKQRDVWDRYDSSIKRPPFTIGIVPRMFDQLGLPQKIIVFGNKDFMSAHYRNTFFEAKVLGGYVEQICPSGGCYKRDTWRSRLVLIGVQKDSEYDAFDDIATLKTEVDWDKVKAFIENGQGKNFLAGLYYPAFRKGAEVERGQAMAFINKHAIQLDQEKLLGIKTSCEKLYDYYWEELAKLRFDSKKGPKKVLSKAELKKRVREKYLRSRSTKSKDRDTFAKRFMNMTHKHFKKYNTCSRYFPTANIKYDKDRFWFFSYVTGFYRLMEIGYRYNCNRGTWEENPIIGKKRQRTVPLQRELVGCTNDQIDQAFMYTPKFLSTLNKQYKRNLPVY